MKNLLMLYLVLLFFCLPVINMSMSSDSVLSSNENRMWATLPSLFVDGHLNYAFGEQFDSWFNDRFWGRQELINLYNKITAGLVSGNEKVLVGRDGWLFYKVDNGVQNYQKSVILSEQQLRDGLKYLQDIDDWCKAHNKKFYYLIAPDKSMIYGEFYRGVNKIHDDTYSIGHQFVNYIRKHSDIKVIYPYDALIAAKQNGDLLYFKHDTHWSDIGAHVGYQELMKAMNVSPVQVNNWGEYAYDGDLYDMYSNVGVDQITMYKTPVLNPIRCENLMADYYPGKEDAQVICSNQAGHDRVFMLRDSFANALKIYLYNTFRQVEMQWKRNITQSDLDNIDKNYDVVILENVERYIIFITQQKFLQ